MDAAETSIFRRGAASDAYGPRRQPPPTGRDRGPYPAEQPLDEFTVKGFEDFSDWLCTEDAAFTLAERRLTVSEQAAFAQAKQKELQSFFDNAVWSFTTTTDPARALKACFLLKRRTGSDGQSEAKARPAI